MLSFLARMKKFVISHNGNPYERLGGEELPEEMFVLGLQHSDRGRYESSLKCFQRASEAVKRLHGEGHAQQRTYQLAAATSLESLRRYDEALATYQRLLDVGPGVADWSRVQALSGAGRALLHLGRHDDALTYLTDALGLCEQVWGPQNEETACCCYALGVVLLERKNFKAAYDLCERAAQIAHKWDEAFAAKCVLRVAYALTGMGRYEDAVERCSEALALYQGFLGSDHPRTVQALMDLGRAHQAAGRVEDAKAWFSQARAARRRGLQVESDSDDECDAMFFDV